MATGGCALIGVQPYATGMPVARHGRGARAAVAAVASQVHPVFMLPPVAAAGFGAILAGTFSLGVAALHIIAIFAAVYTAHVRDGYVDFFIRGEDRDHPLTPLGCRLCLWAAGLTFAAATVALWQLVDGWIVVLTVPCWLIGYGHAPYLDMTTLGETFGYPVGLALAVLGGYYAQSGSLGAEALALAAILFALIGGVKIIDDEQDVVTDRSFGKPSVAVVVGRRRARQLAGGLFGVALVGTGVVAVAGPFPSSALAAPAVFVPVAAMAIRADASEATALLIRGCYVFLAVLITTVWFFPG